MATTKGTRRALRDMTPAEIQAQINKYQSALHGKEIDAALASTDVVAAFAKACAALPKSVSKAQLLEEVGKRAGIPRLVVTQTTAKPRAKKSATEPRAAKRALRTPKAKPVPAS